MVEEGKAPAAEVLPAAGDGTSSDAPRAASDQIDWTSWLKQRMSCATLPYTHHLAVVGTCTSTVIWLRMLDWHCSGVVRGLRYKNER